MAGMSAFSLQPFQRTPMLAAIGHPGYLKMHRLLKPATFLLALAVAGAAHAHTGEGDTNGFVSGFFHPVLGWDHVIAMVAVGLWGARLGAPALWLLPVVFPLVMALGGAAGIAGLPLPHVETGIAASGVVLGLLIAFAVRAPLGVAALIVGIFAIFHGYAHGAELPQAANPFAYAAGFVIATGLLHLAGIALGALSSLRFGPTLIRAAGGIIAATGFAFLLGVA